VESNNDNDDNSFLSIRKISLVENLDVKPGKLENEKIINERSGENDSYPESKKNEKFDKVNGKKSPEKSRFSKKEKKIMKEKEKKQKIKEKMNEKLEKLLQLKKEKKEKVKKESSCKKSKKNKSEKSSDILQRENNDKKKRKIKKTNIFNNFIMNDEFNIDNIGRSHRVAVDPLSYRYFPKSSLFSSPFLPLFFYRNLLSLSSSSFTFPPISSQSLTSLYASLSSSSSFLSVPSPLNFIIPNTQFNSNNNLILFRFIN
jgi:hypothetical protein